MELKKDKFRSNRARKSFDELEHITWIITSHYQAKT